MCADELNNRLAAAPHDHGLAVLPSADGDRVSRGAGPGGDPAPAGWPPSLLWSKSYKRAEVETDSQADPSARHWVTGILIWAPAPPLCQTTRPSPTSCANASTLERSPRWRRASLNRGLSGR